MVMTEAAAARQDIRPLRIGLLNLMPNKIKTETQFARLIGATPLQVELTLVKITSHTPKNTSAEHMLAFYEDWEDVKSTRSSMASSSPAHRSNCSSSRTSPIGTSCRRIYDWTQTHVQSTMNICWGAQAALHHFHGVPKHTLPQKSLRRLPPPQPQAPPRPSCVASRTISRFPCRAGPRIIALTCPRTRGSRC